jgi:PEP-CTERM motif
MAAALRRLALRTGTMVAMALHLPSAQAEATLEAHVVGATCTVTTPEGTTSVVPCSADSWVVALQPNWSAQMVATIEYTYADDGLPLARPQGITIQPHGSVLEVFNEAGALYKNTSTCVGYYCETGRGWEVYTGAGNYYGPVFISANEVADSLTGTLTVTVGALFDGLPPYYEPYTWRPNLYVSLDALSVLTFSGEEPVTAVPESGTFALMLMGLGAVGSVALRRTRSSVNR